MIQRRASCSCGELAVTCTDEPVRVSMCHCLACQRRTGSVFGVQARWPAGSVEIHGQATSYIRRGDSGSEITFRFCPRCGTTVYWTIDRDPQLVAVAVGAFADPNFVAPTLSVYETRRHAWVATPPELDRWD